MTHGSQRNTMKRFALATLLLFLSTVLTPGLAAAQTTEQDGILSTPPRAGRAVQWRLRRSPRSLLRKTDGKWTQWPS